MIAPPKDSLEEISSRLAAEIRPLQFGPPVALVYNPLSYAFTPHRQYLRRWGASPKRVLFVGMNPGPWGMAQTGVPFGEVEMVRDWLGIQGPVGRPEPEHPKRPITGFRCLRSEVSGRRLWGLFRSRFGSPDAFFRDHFVANYCPLVFMAESGANLTPDKLKGEAAELLFRICDRALGEGIGILRPLWVVGIGKFAEKRVRAVREVLFGKGARVSGAPGEEPAFRVASILHPSPANPAANRGWEEAASAALEALGVWEKKV